MSFWGQFFHGLRGLLHRANRDHDAAEEVQQYFEESVAEWKARGLSIEDARRATHREFGTITAVTEQVRSYGWENSVKSILSDLRFALRQLRTNPGFTIVSMLTMAIGIGASTAIFSAVNPILFQSLPYPQSGCLQMIWNTWHGTRSEIAFGTFREFQQRSHTFESLAIFEPWQAAMTGRTRPERLEGQSVSASFFRVLGVAPAMGRDFQPAEAAFEGPKVVILSSDLWQRLFHGAPAVIGRQIKLDDDNYTIVGIMPRGFESVLSPSAEIWTPAQYDTRLITSNFNSWEWGNHLHMIGRLRSGVSFADAERELEQIARSPRPEFPRPRWASLRHGLIVDSLQDDIAHVVKPALLAVLSAVILLLAIASVNVVNLVLARSAQRSGEFVMRGALGASRWRIIRQLVIENLLLASLGGALGISVALAGVRALIALSPAGLPRLGLVAVNPAAFLFALVITVLTGLTAGLIPALYVAGADVQPKLQQSSRRIADGCGWTRRTLVVAEVALAFVLSVSAGLLLRSMQRLLAVNPGFDSSHLLTMQVLTSGHQFDDLASAPGVGGSLRRRFFEQALDAVRRVPGVHMAAFTSLLPLSDDPPVVGLYGAQFEDEDPETGHNVFRYAVSPGYCQTMRIRLLSGRCIDEHDAASTAQVALISESLARSHFPNLNPIGKRLHVGPRNRPWYTIVGIAGDVRQTSLAINQPDAVYLATEQTWFADDTLSFVIRTRGEASSLAPAIRNAIWSVDKNQPIVRVMTMDQLLALSESERRFVLILFEAFGMVALALAAVGMYGVLSSSVAERTREIGVRAALGASRRNIVTLVWGDGMRLMALGVAIGFGGAAAVSKTLAALLFGISGLDPVTWLAVTPLLAVVAGLACWAPAWRAARIDPAVTLRAQ